MSGVTSREWVPQRPRFSKTATGCLPCRQRHLKCDGGRPLCSRCKRDGKPCDGYASVVRALRFELLPGAAEKRSYHYFFDLVAPQIAGHHETGFWTVVLRQVSYTSTALLHAIAALGAIEEHYRAVDILDRARLCNLALTQYGQSLTDLRESMQCESSSILVLLIATVLHVTLELRQSVELSPIQAQVRTAMRLLASSNKPTASEEAVLHRWIRPMLGRRLLQFDPQVETKTCDVEARFCKSSWETFNMWKASTMAGFKGIVEAQDALQAIIEATFTGIHSFAAEGRNADIEHTLRSGIAYLLDWKVAYDRSIARWLPGSHRESLLPQILFQTALSVLRTVVSVNDLPRDEEFVENIRMCEAFMQLHGTAADEGDAFFVDHAVIPGLFFAAVQCKESSLSARAVRALRQRRWREGFWDSRDVADEAERLRLLLHEQSLQTIDLLSHQYIGCAWEFLGASRLIVRRRDERSLFSEMEMTSVM